MAAEDDSQLSEPQFSEFVMSLLNNEFLLENIRLFGLAEESFSEGKYDEAMNYAAEAIRYGELSNEFVSRHIKIRQVDDAIALAQDRLDWARVVGAPASHPEEFDQAETSFSDSLDARSREEWDEALQFALNVLDILGILPEIGTPALPAQFLVRNWHTTRDCLWNIAAMPQVYGDPFQWRHLFTANRDKLRQRNNPHLIHPGMILDIPSIGGEIRSGILIVQ